MIPDAYVAPLISLGLGAVGVAGGYFIGFMPSAEQASLRGARAARADTLTPGELVRLDGTLVCASPLTGPVSGEPIAIARLTRSETSDSVLANNVSRDPDRRRAETAGPVLRAEGLGVKDASGTVLLEPLDGLMVLSTSSWSGAPQSLGARAAEYVTAETTKLHEYSLAPGASVMAVGHVTRDNGRWVMRDRNVLLTNVPSAKTMGTPASARLTGTLLIIASLVGGIGFALASR